MRDFNTNHTPFLFISIFSIFSFKLSSSIPNNDIFCHEIEKQSLIKFKQSLKDPNDLFSSWDSKVDCCKWKGVICSNSTGHVEQLHLQNNPSLQGQINPSLLNLKHLRFLDLSQNNLTQTIPSFLGSLRNLHHLNLSNAGFHGSVPPTIGNLSNLETLSMSGDGNKLASDNLEWLSGLRKLQHVDMSFVNLSRSSSNWWKIINTLPSLQELHFQNCSLVFVSPLSNASTMNISSLTLLDLSHNNFHSQSIPPWIFQLTKLEHLDLSFTSINGPIPTVNRATKLRYLDLSENRLNSTIPDWLYSCKELEFAYFSYSFMLGYISSDVANLTSLKTLSFFGNQLTGKIPREISNMCGLEFLFLTYNQLEGDISDSFGNMSDCFLNSIKLLCLRSNQLYGRIPDSFGDFKKIQFLHFGGNSFSGPIPGSLGKLSSLQEFSLYGNNFSGSLPESYGQLSSLEELYIDDCLLQGTLTEKHFSNLKNLRILSASANCLLLNVSLDWVPPFHLTALKVASWRFVGAGIPRWIESQRSVSELDLSDTGISGTVPSWFWEIPFLNLTRNNLRGEIPNLSRARYLYVSSNKFSGSLPGVGDALVEMDLSNNSFLGFMTRFVCNSSQTHKVEILHLAGNQLIGKLPDCWKEWASLKYLNLGDNKLSGVIPNSIGFLANLQSLNLYRNSISGHIPSSLRNCKQLLKIELSENHLDGSLQPWIGTTLVKLRILILRSNKFNGEIPSEICHLISLQILDLSQNKFSGAIPNCVQNLTAMATKRSLNQYDYSSSSYNGASFIDSALVATKGSILQYDTILSLVTNIDLSSNDLCGEIPNGVTSLVELRSLNLSKNSLTGLIPRNVGDMKELESLDLSRNFLSGQLPSSLSLAYALNHLNLSYNNLTGGIPKGTQIQSFDASSFVGNDLCGPPLTSGCNGDDGEVMTVAKEGKDGDGLEVDWLYVFVSCGYVVGFSVVCATLWLNKSWRDAYFAFIFKENV
ncbi:hypothetical protein SASPL_133570 [Salvia splendens]|uniref:LRR receptor-like serine/threonine-protein kinase FLS2 n=1 Tax=Salvia splendens TaxID=180675 RepID=A0A8X8ZJ89_SALSN|nr:receptor-like protein EIX2 [Salvia splendens]KAG6405974.1 hypothetical protein SASPL_133570 [Salvia splendens]